jgi:hypothetical protein
MTFERDPAHWLFQHSADEWISAALAEIGRASRAYASRDARGGLACARRAAGMALNGALIAEPNAAWGRSYVDHVRALAREASAPELVRKACDVLLEARAPAPGLLLLRSPGGDRAVLEAARDVMAHAYAKVKRHEV